MAATKQGGAAVAERPREFRPGVASATIPVRMLHAIRVAFKQDTKFAMSSLLVRSRKKKGNADVIQVIGTDGRRMVIAEHDTDLFSGVVDMIIPGDVARKALQCASKSEDDEPTATIEQNRNAYVLKVSTPSGNARFDWKTDGNTLPFAPFEEMLPDFKMFGVSEIGVSPDRMTSTLTTVKMIVGPDHDAKLYLPDKPDRPLGLEATDGATIKVTAVVMPATIEGWTEVPKAEGEKADEHQREMFDAWRGEKIDGSGGLTALTAGQQSKLIDAGLKTVGQLSDYLVAGKALTNIEGIANAGAEKITDALATYFKDRKITPPTKPATPEEEAIDKAQEALLAYVGQRYISIGVTPEQLEDDAVGQKLDEAAVALVFTAAQAKTVGKTFESGTLADVKAWHEKLKDCSDDQYRKAAKSAGVDVGAKTKKPVLPS